LLVAPKEKKTLPRGVSRFIDRDELIREALRLRTRRAWGDWLRQFPWDHFATLTFANAASLEDATRLFRRWVRHLEQRAQGSLDWFYVLERGAGGLLHIHSLTQGTGGLDAAALRHSWPGGRSDVSRYDPAKGATHYVSKWLGGDSVDYDISAGNLQQPAGLARSLPRDAIPPKRVLRP
jgi:hypothetical protein